MQWLALAPLTVPVDRTSVGSVGGWSGAPSSRSPEVQWTGGAGPQLLLVDCSWHWEELRFPGTPVYGTAGSPQATETPLPEDKAELKLGHILSF